MAAGAFGGCVHGAAKIGKGARLDWDAVSSMYLCWREDGILVELSFSVLECHD